MTEKKLKKYAVSYGQGRHKIRVMVPYPRNPRTGICQVCGRSKKKGEIKTTQLHHWWYKYKIETVKKNPLLVLENTVEVCYGCHRIADWLREATTGTRPENFQRIINTAKKMPEWMQKRLTKICKLWLEEMKKR